MGDVIEVKDTNEGFDVHPEGQYVGLCVDQIDLGERVEEYVGKPKKLVPKIALVFRTGTRGEKKGEIVDVSVEFTRSMYETAGMRKFLESWRGKSYTDDQAKEGVQLHRLDGMAALISVECVKSRGGKNYAKIKSIAPLPSMIPVPSMPAYTRAEFWATRKKQYLDESTKFRNDIGISAQAPSAASSFEDVPLPDSPDDLPF